MINIKALLAKITEKLTLTKLRISSYSSGWSYYGNNKSNRPVLRVVGNIVHLTGIMTNTATKTLNATAQTIFTIPTEYAPSDCAVVQAMVGSSYYKYAVAVTIEGNVQFSRYSAETAYPSISAGAWFPFNLTWIID